MKKPKKLLRKLLAKYRDDLAKKPCKQVTEIVDCITVILEFLQNENH